MPHLAEQLPDAGFRFCETLEMHALLRSHEVAEAARAELLRAGFSVDDIHTWADERGAALGVSDGHGHQDTVRVAPAWTGNRQMLERYTSAMRRGRVGIRIQCASENNVWLAERILERYSARAITYVAEAGLPT